MSRVPWMISLIASAVVTLVMAMLLWPIAGRSSPGSPVRVDRADASLELAQTAPELPVPTPVPLDTPTSGSFTASDPHMDAYYPQYMPALGMTDAFSIEGTAGVMLEINVTSSVPGFITAYDSTASPQEIGMFVEAGDPGYYLYMPTQDTSVTILVCSYLAREGVYSLHVRPASTESIEAFYAAVPILGDLTAQATLTHEVTSGGNDHFLYNYTVEVPEGATALTIQADAAQNIDVFVRRDRPITSVEEATYQGTEPTGEESLRIHMGSHPILQSGRYYVAVIPIIPATERADAFPFTFSITARITTPEVPEAVIVDTAPGPLAERHTRRLAGSLEPGQRGLGQVNSAHAAQVWSIQVPEGADHLEVRTYDATGRLELAIITPGAPPPLSMDAILALPNRARSGRDNERVLITPAEGQSTIAPGVYTILVLDFFTNGTSDYALAASFTDALDPLPQFVPPTSEELAALGPLERSVRATVQITANPDEGSSVFGSGTILTPDGIILTNHHVIGECNPAHTVCGCHGDILMTADGQPARLYIGISNESEPVAEQAYLGRVIRTLPDYDLALVQITSDLEGRPPVFPIPFAPFDAGVEAVSLASSVRVIGYPATTQLGSRISLSVTEGIVTGFTEEDGRVVLLNIDANIAGGNSGGALVNADGYLVGVPSNTFTNFERGDRHNFARPLSLLPQSWIDLLVDHGATVLP